MRLLAFRYSFVPHTQTVLGALDVPVPKGAMLLAALGTPQKNAQFLYWKREYAFAGFKGVPYGGKTQDGLSERFIIGKIAKRTTVNRGDLVPGDVLETDMDSWLYVWVVIDLERQSMLVEHNNDFGSAQQVENVLVAGTRHVIHRVYGHQTFIIPVTDPAQFWKVVEENGLLYKIELNLVSPNILETDRAARESLEALKGVFAQDEVTVTLQSHQGKLNADRRLLEQYLRYIAEGEGYWTLVVRKAKRAARKIYTSRTQVKSVTAAMPEPAESERLSLDERRAAEERAVVEAAQRFAQGID